MDDLGSVVADVTVAVEAMEADYETMAVAMPLTVTVTVITESLGCIRERKWIAVTVQNMEILASWFLLPDVLFIMYCDNFIPEICFRNWDDSLNK